VRVNFDYGKTGLEAELPDDNLVGVLGMPASKPLTDVVAAVRAAIAEPIGAAPLADLAARRRRACIVVCDITRPVPTPSILPVLLEALGQAGMSPSQVTVLVATGTHRPNEGDELERLVGREALQTVRVENHFCRDEHPFVGTSPNGVPVYLNRHYLHADLRITVGMIEPHFMAGYAGGRKMVMPGVAGLASVQEWHSPRFLEHPKATNGEVEGNPVHEECLAIARMAPPDFIIDCALDSAKRPCAFFAGDMERAWEAGVTFVRRHVRAELSQPVDIVVTSGGGYPLDLTFYQAIKGMVGALPIANPGASIVIASECAEGIGNAHFAECLFSLDRIDDFPERITSPDWEFVPDQWQIELFARAARDRTIYMVCTGIKPEVLGRLFVNPQPTIEAALDAAFAVHGQSATLAAIPKGPYVLPARR
jgi:lactate racemase